MRVRVNESVNRRSSKDGHYSDSVHRSEVSKCNMNCMLMNAQSLRSKFDEFRCVLAIQKPDIVCVTETWVSEGFWGDRLQYFELQSYNMFSYCRESRQGGGVFLYVNNLYYATRVEDSTKAKEVESIWIDVKNGTRSSDVLRIGAFYRPGNLARALQYEADIILCEELRKNCKPNCLIMGDFNLRGYEDRAETNDCIDV